jgi:PEP-CTERM motif
LQNIAKVLSNTARSERLIMKLHIIAWVATLAFAATASATPVINQSASAINAPMASFAQTGLAQSFIQSAADITGAGILILSGDPGTVTIGLYDQLPTAGGTLLAQGSAPASSETWVDVFWSSVGLAANTTYYLVFSSTEPSLMIGGDTNNGYADGQVHANNFNAFSNFDYAFRTYASDDAATNTLTPTSNPAPVSEPGTLALVGLALLASVGLGRRSA